MALFKVLPIELSKLASVVHPPFQLTRWGVLQRSILAVGEIEESKRGGRRGYRQKVTQLTQGVEQGNYMDQEPCVLESEFGFSSFLLDAYKPYYFRLVLFPVWIASDAETVVESRPKDQSRGLLHLL